MSGYRLAAQEYDPAIPVSEISEHPDNPNEADLDLLAESLDRFGFIGAIVVHKASRHILAGNHRFRQAAGRGAETIPGFWLDVDEETARQWMVTDNDTARQGRWREDKLLALLEPMTGLPPGFTYATVEELRAALRPADLSGLRVAPLPGVQTLPLEAVKPYWRNPRKINDKAVEQTAASIREFGWQQPIVVDAEHVIIAGHTRWLASRKLGLAEVPVVVSDMDETRARAYRIADNRSRDYTDWAYGLLARELDGLDEQFAGVLDLADWQQIITAFEDGPAGGELTGEERHAIGLGGFALTVIFASEEDADRAAPGLLDLPGVINVRRAIKQPGRDSAGGD